MTPSSHVAESQVPLARTAQGIIALFMRQIVIYPIALVGSILLARLLHPAEFGIYAIASFVVMTVASFSDVGLGAAFIQRAEPPSLREQRTLFTCQSGVAVTLFALLYALAPQIVRFYSLEAGTTWVFRVLSLNLLLGTFATIPAIRLERGLAYRQFAILDVINALIYQPLIIALAWFGYGVWSFVIGGVACVLIRSLILYGLAPWPIGFAWDTSLLRESLKFGGFFQLSSLTALLRDNLVALLAGPVFGPRAVGYLNWAHGTALLSSQIFTQLTSRVMFPSLSRLNEDPDSARRMIEKSLRYLMLGTLPILGWLVVFMPEIVHYIYTDKWQAGIPAFYWYALGMLGGHFTTVLDGALKAAGQVKRSLIIMTSWTAVDWLLAVIFIHLWGFYGVAIAHGLAVWLAAGLLVHATEQRFAVDYRSSVLIPGEAAVAMTALLVLVRLSLPHHLVTALILGALGLGVYALLLWAMEGKALVADVKTMIALVRA